MSQDVKHGSRPYDNRNRQRQAQRTRRRVVDAARVLFVRDGYAPTTIQALADEAGVAVQTVYAAFGSKLEVLKRLFDASIVGVDENVRMVDRPEWRAWEVETDVTRLFRAFVRMNRQVCERTADIVGVIEAASGSHPEIESMWEHAEAARYEDQRRIVDRLADLRLLRTGLSPRQAADIVWTLAGPAPYTALVRRRGWSAVEYEVWLAEQLRCALLRIQSVRS